MFGLMKKLVSGPNPKVIHSLRMSINSLDMHLAVRDVNPDIAFARASIFSGAALIRDVSIAFREADKFQELLRGDINAVFPPVADAHRAAVVGMATMILGSSALHGRSPMDLIFESEPKSKEDEEVMLAVSSKNDESADAQQLGLSKQIAKRLSLSLSSNQLQELVRHVNKRLADFRTLSEASANRPFLDFLRSDIL